VGLCLYGDPGDTSCEDMGNTPAGAPSGLLRVSSLRRKVWAVLFPPPGAGRVLGEVRRSRGGGGSHQQRSLTHGFLS
jgi:hypothetical protein